MRQRDFRRTSVPQLFATYVGVLKELRRRNITRSTNNLAADYAEFLVSRALGLTLLTRSTAGFDAIDKNGKRYEIKSRRITAHNKSRQLSVLRGMKKRHFDYLIGVLFAEDFTIQRVCLVPFRVVNQLSTYRKHVNGWIFHLRDIVWKHPGVKDITRQVRSQQEL